MIIYRRPNGSFISKIQYRNVEGYLALVLKNWNMNTFMTFNLEMMVYTIRLKNIYFFKHWNLFPEVTPEKTVEKPALPAKPTSPTRTPRSPTASFDTTSTTPPSKNSKDITSPALVSSLQKVASNKKEAASAAAENGDSSLQVETSAEVPRQLNAVAEHPVEIDDTFPQPEDLEDDEELMEEYPGPCGGGVRERTLLCPIQEEDTESTASGSSVSVANNTKRSSVINNNNTTEHNTNAEDTPEVIQEEIHDGHYFIKVCTF